MDKYQKLAEAFRADIANRQADIRKYGSADAADAARREATRAECVSWIAACSKIEVTNSRYSKIAGEMRRKFATELLCKAITADTPFAS